VTDIVAGMALGVVMGYYMVGFIPTEMFQWIFFFIFFYKWKYSPPVF
jgi:uncharacterized membrane protein YfcA